MQENKNAITFLSQYPEPVPGYALQLRALVLKMLPGIIEQLDIPAKMVGYCYGHKYADLVCVIIQSKKGLKLGFNGGVDLPDPAHLLEGTGKISRYVVIRSTQQIRSAAIKNLLKEGLKAYKKRTAG